MSESWLVIDLRTHRFAAGILSPGRPVPRWQPLAVPCYVDPNATPDQRETVDLSFYLDPRSKSWSPAERETLEELDADRYQKIPCLLDEPVETIRQMKPSPLNALIVKLFQGEASGLPVLFLIARPDWAALVEPYSLARPGRTAVIERPAGTLAPYALLDPSMQGLPKPGQSTGVRTKDGQGGEKTAWFLWQGWEAVPCEGKGDRKVPRFDGTMADLDRAGAALYELFWKDRMSESLEVELKRLRKAVREKSDLAARMRTLLGHLQDQGLYAAA